MPVWIKYQVLVLLFWSFGPHRKFIKRIVVGFVSTFLYHSSNRKKGIAWQSWQLTNLYYLYMFSVTIYELESFSPASWREWRIYQITLLLFFLYFRHNVVFGRHHVVFVVFVFHQSTSQLELELCTLYSLSLVFLLLVLCCHQTLNKL